MNYFHDPEYGGFYWEVSPNGNVRTDMKQGYGNVHPILALAQAYAVTRNPDHLQAALDQLAIFQDHFIDPAYACGIRPNLSRDFSQVIGVNNVDVFTHWFEALLSLYDITEGAQRDEISALITTCGDFLVNTLYQDQEGFTDRGYVAYNYNEQWRPSQIPYSRDLQWSGAMHATTGHNIELAYLLSRAVERGFNEEWLQTADKLIKFCLEYAIDFDTGGMLYDTTDYEGQPLEGNPDNPLYIWWAQLETARALLHFIVVRGVDDYETLFKLDETLIHTQLTDQEYGGLYHGLDSEHDLAPVGVEKGDIWKTGYHYSMYFAEVLRLAANYPDRLAELNAAVRAG
jgi:mannobiose 2-epimerase